jgi:hypothetical protein
MSETLFDYQTRLRDEEVLYLLRAIATKEGIVPFPGVSEPAPQTPPLRVVEVEALEKLEASEEETPVTIQYAKFDPLCRTFADDRNYFGDLVKLNPSDKVAQTKLDDAKRRAMHRNRAISKIIDSGAARYDAKTYRCEFNLDNGGTWVPWRAEFCPQTEIKKRRARKSK